MSGYSLNSSFVPDESPSDFWQERANMAGGTLMCVAYGILFTLACQCVDVLVLRHRGKVGKKEWGLLGCTLVILSLATIFVAFQSKFNEQMYIDDRNFPGGPAAFNAEEWFTWAAMGANTSFIMLNWFCDALLLYRYIVIWSFNYWMLIFPVLMFLGSFASSIALLYLEGRSDIGFWSPKTVQFGIAYWTLSISLNIILTLMIVARLAYQKRRLTKAMGNSHGQIYVSISAMLVESAAIYSICGLIYLIAYARNDPFNYVVLPPQGQLQGVSSLLIILRVGSGQAWSRNTAANVDSEVQMSTMVINSGSRGDTETVLGSAMSQTRSNLSQDNGRKKKSIV